MKNYSIILLAFLILSSCNAVRKNQSAENLKQTQWELVAIDQEALDADALGRALPTMQFDTAGTRVSGNAGCNRYNGTVELSGDSLHFGPLMSTKMACDQMELEQQFMRHLTDQSLGCQVKDGTLILSSEQGELRFKAAE